MSERGPKGDHGQHGDTGTRGVAGARGQRGTHGDTGDPGERGAHGDTGQEGAAGRRGARGPSNWQSYVAMGVAVIVAFAVFGDRLDDKPSKEQTGKIAALSRQNARTIQQIEQVRADTRRDALETKVALCALRADLRRRVRGAREFLAKHPDGAFGFTPQEIREGIVNQRRTITALRGLNCK